MTDENMFGKMRGRFDQQAAMQSQRDNAIAVARSIMAMSDETRKLVNFELQKLTSTLPKERSLYLVNGK